MKLARMKIQQTLVMAGTLFVCGSALSFAGGEVGGCAEPVAAEIKEEQVSAPAPVEQSGWRAFLLNKEFREPGTAR